MRVETISATALESFDCPSRFWAEKVMKADDPSGVFANLGTAAHGALERWVIEGWHLQRPMADVTVLEAFFIEEYYKLFDGYTDFFDQGIEMIRNWYHRQDWNGVEVISTEVKQRFALKIPGDDDQLVTYIFDRLDMWKRTPDAPAVPRVVDYKSYGQPVDADDMKQRIQPRLYACAAQLLYPDAPGIWVVYDLLRYDEVGVYYTKEENRETYRWLQGLVRRIRATEPLPTPEGELDLTVDGIPRYEERVNPGCRYCPRKTTCKALERNIAVGGQFSYQNVNEAIDKAAQLKWMEDAAKAARQDLTEFIMQSMTADNATEAETSEVRVKISSKNMTIIDGERAARVIPDHILLRYLAPNITVVNKIIKDPEVDDATKAALKGMMEKRRGSPFLKFTSKAPEGDE